MSSDVKSHYNSQANQHGSRDDALKSRRQGACVTSSSLFLPPWDISNSYFSDPLLSGGAYPLKAFHNSVKRYLISQLAGGSDCHLDIACGRGGDLDKWRVVRLSAILCCIYPFQRSDLLK